jgi:hypothetical protein
MVCTGSVVVSFHAVLHHSAWVSYLHSVDHCTLPSLLWEVLVVHTDTTHNALQMTAPTSVMPIQIAPQGETLRVPPPLA